jgi:hypothetical protein
VNEIVLCGTLRYTAAIEPLKKPRNPSLCTVSDKMVRYGIGHPPSPTCRIHFTRWMGCFAKVAAKPETAPDAVVIAVLVSAPTL